MTVLIRNFLTANDKITSVKLSKVKIPLKFAVSDAKELCPLVIGEDPNDITKIWHKLMWVGASVGRSGIAIQAIAAFDNALLDMKAKRANLSLAKLISAHYDSLPVYNTSGGYLQAPIEEVVEKARI
jgi:L-alanine-DL-glutamate epimerase-like enolase superfamily enzyme